MEEARIERLIQQLKNAINKDVRVSAAQALGKHGNPRAQ